MRRFTQKDPKEPKRTQKEPKRTQKDPKGTQMDPNGTQKDTTRGRKAVQVDPDEIQRVEQGCLTCQLDTILQKQGNIDLSNLFIG